MIAVLASHRKPLKIPLRTPSKDHKVKRGHQSDAEEAKDVESATQSSGDELDTRMPSLLAPSSRIKSIIDVSP